MLNDLDVIVKKFPAEQNELHVYAIGDTHVGSEQFDEKTTRKKIQIIADDPLGVLCICGDLGDYGLKNSVSNVYRQTMNPAEQQKFILELFEPVKHKIVAAVAGNHEERITKETGLCPLYDLCVLWGCPDVYRENVAITKYAFGQTSNKKRQHVFIGITSHGSTRNKHQRFAAGFNADFSISAHTHRPEYTPHGRIVIDPIHATARQVAYKELVVDANMTVGGYGLKHEYEILPPPELQYFELTAVRDSDRNRTTHKVINFHSIQL